MDKKFSDEIFKLALLGVQFYNDTSKIEFPLKIKFSIPKEIIIDEESAKIVGFDSITQQELIDYIKSIYNENIGDLYSLKFLCKVRDEVWDRECIVNYLQTFTYNTLMDAVGSKNE